MVGHSIFLPLYLPAAQLFYLKASPSAARASFLASISEHKVRSMFTAPTAIRAIKKEDLMAINTAI